MNWISTQRHEPKSRFLQRTRFRSKNCFRMSRIVGNLALKQSFSRSIYTLKTSKLAFLSILGKVIPEKVVFNKKAFCIKIFENYRFLNHILYNASYFESTDSNASDLEPFFYNSTNFESKILERVIFRKKMGYNAIDFEVELICTKTDFDECFAFRKSPFGSF